MAPKLGSTRPPFTELHKKNMSIARKAQWAKLPVEERIARMNRVREGIKK